MGAAFGLAHLELGAAADHRSAMADELLQHALECHHFRPAVHQRQEDDAYRLLQRRILVDLIEDQVRVGVALEVDDETYRLAVAGTRFIADIADSFYLFFFDQIADRGSEAIARLLIRHFGDDDLRLAVLLADVGASAERDFSATCGVAVGDALPTADDAARRKVGTGDDFQQILKRYVRFVDDLDGGITDFAQIMRRDVGSHAYGDAVGAVDQQIRELARQNERLAILAVVALNEIHRVGFEIGEHLGADVRQPSLGVTMSGRRQPGDGAEIALWMHEGIAHVPVLRHAHQRRIDRLIAVWMIALHRFANDAGAFRGRAGGAESEIVHRHEDASLRRFQAVAHVGQGPTDDDAHSVGEVAILQLVGDVERIVAVAVTARLGRNMGWRSIRRGRRGRNIIWQSKYPP